MDTDMAKQKDIKTAPGRPILAEVARRPPDLMEMALLFILGMFLLGCVCYLAASSEVSVRRCDGSECIREKSHEGHRKPPPDFDVPLGLFFPGFPL